MIRYDVIAGNNGERIYYKNGQPYSPIAGEHDILSSMQIGQAMVIDEPYLTAYGIYGSGGNQGNKLKYPDKYLDANTAFKRFPLCYSNVEEYTREELIQKYNLELFAEDWGGNHGVIGFMNLYHVVLDYKGERVLLKNYRVWDRMEQIAYDDVSEIDISNSLNVGEVMCVSLDVDDKLQFQKNGVKVDRIKPIEEEKEEFDKMACDLSSHGIKCDQKVPLTSSLEEPQEESNDKWLNKDLSWSWKSLSGI